MDSAPPRTVSVSEAARILGVSRTLTYDLVAQGQLPSIRLGRRIVVPYAHLIALIEGRAGVGLPARAS